MQKAERVYYTQIVDMIEYQNSIGNKLISSIELPKNEFVLIFDTIQGTRHNKILEILDVDVQDILDKYHTPDNYDSMLQTYRIKEEDVKKIIKEITKNESFKI